MKLTTDRVGECQALSCRQRSIGDHESLPGTEGAIRPSVPTDEFAHSGNEIHRNRHGRVGCRLKCGFVFGDGFFIGLGFEVFQDPPYPSLIPSGWVIR
jgi:hypothetical protein